MNTLTAHMTACSSNIKTGKIPVSTTSRGTCPNCCPFKDDGGCYGENYPIKYHWNAVSNRERGGNWSAFCKTVESLPSDTLWRYGQVGDCPGDGVKIDRDRALKLTHANKGKRNIAYTHYDVTGECEGRRVGSHNRRVVREMNRNGFTVNLSGNDLSHADQLWDLDIAPVVVVLPEHQKRATKTPKGRTVAICPATKSDNVTCATCKLCSLPSRDYVIGFPAHGAKRKSATATANG